MLFRCKPVASSRRYCTFVTSAWFEMGFFCFVFYLNSQTGCLFKCELRNTDQQGVCVWPGRPNWPVKKSDISLITTNFLLLVFIYFYVGVMITALKLLYQSRKVQGSGDILSSFQRWFSSINIPHNIKPLFRHSAMPSSGEKQQKPN